jgi:hypothetical protein
MSCECGNCMCGDNKPQNYFNVVVLKNEDGTYQKAEFESSTWNQKAITEDGK